MQGIGGFFAVVLLIHLHTNVLSDTIDLYVYACLTGGMVLWQS